jgi:hypothetical protein
VFRSVSRRLGCYLWIYVEQTRTINFPLQIWVVRQRDPHTRRRGRDPQARRRVELWSRRARRPGRQCHRRRAWEPTPAWSRSCGTLVVASSSCRKEGSFIWGVQASRTRQRPASPLDAEFPSAVSPRPPSLVSSWKQNAERVAIDSGSWLAMLEPLSSENYMPCSLCSAMDWEENAKAERGIQSPEDTYRWMWGVQPQGSMGNFYLASGSLLQRSEI